MSTVAGHARLDHRRHHHRHVHDRHRPLGTAGRDGRPERGSGTVLALAVSMVLALAAGAAVLVGQVTTIRHRADAAADLAALAGARTAREGGDPCTVAGRIASANGGRLRSCVVDPAGTGGSAAAGQVLVRVAVSATVLGGRTLTAVGRARAGEAP